MGEITEHKGIKEGYCGASTTWLTQQQPHSTLLPDFGNLSSLECPKQESNFLQVPLSFFLPFGTFILYYYATFFVGWGGVECDVGYVLDFILFSLPCEITNVEFRTLHFCSVRVRPLRFACQIFTAFGITFSVLNGKPLVLHLPVLSLILFLSSF